MGKRLSELFPDSESLLLSDRELEESRKETVVEALQLPQIRKNRMPISDNIPSHEDLIAQKKKKRLLTVGTELFNQTPAKGCI